MGCGPGLSASAAYSTSFASLYLAVVDAVDLENALGQGAGLIKDHGLDLGQRFQIVGAFDQDAGPAGAADAARRSSAGC